MQLSLAALIPVLDRPQLVKPLTESFHASWLAETGWRARLLFIATPGDTREIRALEDASADYIIAPFGGNARGQYAKKLNHAITLTEETWLFLGADDLAFHPGWLRAAIDVHIATGARVIGTNDLGNATVIRGEHATHSLVHRDYIEQGTIDDPSRLLCELYDHNSVDVEFVETAKMRGEFAFARDSRVEHLHRLWGKAPIDATYRKGLRNATADRRLMLSRRHLWRTLHHVRGPKVHGRWP